MADWPCYRDPNLAMSCLFVCAGLSPALQRTWTLPVLHAGKVNRIGRVEIIASGKPVNTARAARALQAPPTVCCPVGGETGAAWLRHLHLEGGIEVVPVAVSDPMRICATVFEQTGSVITELVEEAACPDENKRREWQAEVVRLAGQASILVLAGNLPPGVPATSYAEIIEACRREDLVTVVDASGPVAAEAVRAGVTLLKMNREEWARTAPLMQEQPARCIVTDGPNEVVWTESGQTRKCRPPNLTARNTTGCGDAFTAGLALAYTRTRNLDQAVRWGIACGSAAAVTEIPGELDPAVAATWEQALGPLGSA